MIKKFFARQMFPKVEDASQGLWDGFHSLTFDSHTFVDTEHLIHSWFPDVSDVPLSSGAEGSQGSLFCREGREEVREREMCKQ